MFGELEKVTCSGRTLALFRRLEDAAGDNLMADAEQAADEIDALGFLVSIDGRESQTCLDLQVMNAVDVCFKVSSSDE
jgi:hypothetical protein